MTGSARFIFFISLFIVPAMAILASYLFAEYAFGSIALKLVFVLFGLFGLYGIYNLSRGGN